MQTQPLGAELKDKEQRNVCLSGKPYNYRKTRVCVCTCVRVCSQTLHKFLLIYNKIWCIH